MADQLIVEHLADPVLPKEDQMTYAYLLLALAAITFSFSVWTLVRALRERARHKRSKQDYEKRKALQEHLAGKWSMGPPTGDVGCPCKDARLLAAFADWSMTHNATELAQLREIVNRISQAELDNLSKGRDSITALTEQIDAHLSNQRHFMLGKEDAAYIKSKKYVLHPGHVRASDTDRHFIGVVELCNLYKVSLANCLVDDGRGMRGIDTTDKIHLYPRADGNYVHPDMAAKKV
jgi:hypothetical protein